MQNWVKIRCDIVSSQTNRHIFALIVQRVEIIYLNIGKNEKSLSDKHLLHTKFLQHSKIAAEFFLSIQLSLFCIFLSGEDGCENQSNDED